MSKRVRGRKAAAGKVKQDTRNAIVGAILFACLVALYVYTRWNTEPQTSITGKAWVIDGDTIVISDTHIRLEGIDAPESDQSCTDTKGKPWPCGRTAASELRAHIKGQELTCQPRALDKYKRVLAVCALSERLRCKCLAGAARLGHRLWLCRHLRGRGGTGEICEPRDLGRNFCVAIAMAGS